MLIYRATNIAKAIRCSRMMMSTQQNSKSDTTNILQYISTLYKMAPDQVKELCEQHSIMPQPNKEDNIVNIVRSMYIKPMIKHQGIQELYEEATVKEIQSTFSSLYSKKYTRVSTSFSFPIQLDWPPKDPISLWNLTQSSINAASRMITFRNYSKSTKVDLQKFVMNLINSENANQHFAIIISCIQFMKDFSGYLQFRELLKALTYKENVEYYHTALFDYIYELKKDLEPKLVANILNQLMPIEGYLNKPGMLSMIAEFYTAPNFSTKILNANLNKLTTFDNFAELNNVLPVLLDQNLINENMSAIKIICAIFSRQFTNINYFTQAISITEQIYQKFPMIFDPAEKEFINRLLNSLLHQIQALNIDNEVTYKTLNLFLEWNTDIWAMMRTLPFNNIHHKSKEIDKTINYLCKSLESTKIYQNMIFSKKLKVMSNSKALHLLTCKLILSLASRDIIPFNRFTKLLASQSYITLEYLDDSSLKIICESLCMPPDQVWESKEGAKSYLQSLIIYNSFIKILMLNEKNDYEQNVKAYCLSNIDNPEIAYYYLKIFGSNDKDAAQILSCIEGIAETKINKCTTSQIMAAISCCSPLWKYIDSNKNYKNAFHALTNMNNDIESVQPLFLEDFITSYCMLDKFTPDTFLSVLHSSMHLNNPFKALNSKITDKNFLSELMKSMEGILEQRAKLYNMLIDKSMQLYNEGVDNFKFKALASINQEILSKIDNKRILSIMQVLGRHTFYNYSIELLSYIHKTFANPTLPLDIEILNTWPSFMQSSNLTDAAISLGSNSKTPLKNKLNIQSFLTSQNEYSHEISIELLHKYKQMEQAEFTSFLEQFSTYGYPLKIDDINVLLEAMDYHLSASMPLNAISILDGMFIIASSCNPKLNQSKVKKWNDFLGVHFANMPKKTIYYKGKPISVNCFPNIQCDEMEFNNLIVDKKFGDKIYSLDFAVKSRGKMYSKVGSEVRMPTDVENELIYFTILNENLPQAKLKFPIKIEDISNNHKYFKYNTVAKEFELSIPEAIQASMVFYNTLRNIRNKSSNVYHFIHSIGMNNLHLVSDYSSIADFTSDTHQIFILSNEELFKHKNEDTPIRYIQYVLEKERKNMLNTVFVGANWNLDEVKNALGEVARKTHK